MSAAKALAGSGGVGQSGASLVTAGTVSLRREITSSVRATLVCAEAGAPVAPSRFGPYVPGVFAVFATLVYVAVWDVAEPLAERTQRSQEKARCGWSSAACSSRNRAPLMRTSSQSIHRLSIGAAHPRRHAMRPTNAVLSTV